MFKTILSAAGFALAASAASAAVIPFDLTLEYTGRTFFNVEIRDDDTDALIENFEALPETRDRWGLARTAGDYGPRERVRFRALIDFAEGPAWDFGDARECHFGILDCGGWKVDGGPERFSMAVDPFASNEGTYLFIGTATGDSAQRVAPAVTRLAAKVPGEYYALVGDESASFQVIADNLAPAPIPLPASAALLPLGLIGLAALRRRQRGA